MKVRNIKALVPFKGYVVRSLTFEKVGAQINLEFDKRSGPRCPSCNQRLARNKVTRRVVYDNPMPHGTLTLLTFPTAQALCKRCNHYVTSCPQEVHPTCKATYRFMRQISSWASVATADDVAAMFEISPSSVRRYDKIILRETTPEPDLDNLKCLLIDEKSPGKKRPFVTVIINGETGELLHMAEGKKRESVESFYEKLTDEQKAGIRVVGMDRSGAYQAATEAYLPNAEIVYDRFHLVMNVNQAVDEVRRSQWREAAREDKTVIKGKRYLMLKNPDKLDQDGRESLDELLNANVKLSTAYVLKEQFRSLFHYQKIGWAKRALKGWCEMAASSGLPPFKRLAKTFGAQADRVCGFVKHRLTSGRIEGFNNLMSRLIHRACGIKDMGYLELRLRHHTIMRS